nr:MAG TPA: hypothetical protein [Caudoviricetes sp.]
MSIAFFDGCLYHRQCSDCIGIQHHIALSRCHSLMAAFVHPKAKF